jgi:hypothetical protein
MGVGVSVKVASGIAVLVKVSEMVTVAVGIGVGAEQAVSKTNKREMRNMFFMGSLLSWGLYSAE